MLHLEYSLITYRWRKEISPLFKVSTGLGALFNALELVGPIKNIAHPVRDLLGIIPDAR